MSLLIGESTYLAKRLDESNEWISRAAGLYGDLGNSSGLAFVLIRMAVLASLRGQAARAGDHIHAARRSIDASAMASHLRPRLLEAAIKCSEGLDQTRAILSEAQDLVAHARQTCPTCSIGLGVAAAIACASAGDLTKARHWLDFADRRASVWSGTPWQAAVWEARGALRLAEGHRDQSVALMSEAADLYRKFGHRLDEARCRSSSS